MKKLVIAFMRLLSKPTVLVLFPLAGLVIGLLKDWPKEGMTALSLVALGAIGFNIVSALRDAGIIRAMWEWIAGPDYTGFEEFLEQIGMEFSAAYISRKAAGRLVIDAAIMVEAHRSVIGRLRLCGSDRDAHENAALMNAKAFSGSKYQGTTGTKFKRNLAIGERCPAAIALISSPDDVALYTALSGVFPLSEYDHIPYVMGKISDNAIDASSIAALDEAAGAILFFMVANQPCKNRTLIKRGPGLATLSDIIGACLIQALLLTRAHNGGKEMPWIAANSQPKMRRLFERLQFQERRSLDTKDNERIFTLRVEFTNGDAALDQLIARNESVCRHYGYLRPGLARTACD